MPSHNVAHRKLGRVTEHRLALLRNQATALLRHERIETTMPKAKELRPFVERLITIAKRGVAVGDPKGSDAARAPPGAAEIPDREVVGKLFDTLAPRFAERPGGYTRILRVGFRRGDAAEVAQVELVGSEYDAKAAEAARAEQEKDAPKKTKGVGERLKQAAQRIRGGGRPTAARRRRPAVRPRAPSGRRRRRARPADRKHRSLVGWQVASRVQLFGPGFPFVGVVVAGPRSRTRPTATTMLPRPPPARVPPWPRR